MAIRRTDPDENRFAVYLVDPGPRGSGVIALIQEVTGASTGNCAQMVRTSPTFITSCRTRGAAEDLIARFKEFDAVAVIRPAGRPLREGPSAELMTRSTPRPVPYLLMLLGVAQLGMALWWARDGRMLAAVGGAILSVVVMISSVLLLRGKLD
jgi:hypothetical protein